MQLNGQLKTYKREKEFKVVYVLSEPYQEVKKNKKNTVLSHLR